MAITKWKLTSDKYKALANLALQENGREALEAEVSLMCNLTDLQTKYKDPYEYCLRSGWFSNAEYYLRHGSATGSDIEKVINIVERGSRKIPRFIDEHDAFGDIEYIVVNGNKYSCKEKEQIRKRSNYIQGKTVIKNKYGSKYTFWIFPSAYSDPFGYTDYAYKKFGGDTKTTETKKSTVDTQTTKTVVSEKTIKICGHGSGNPSTKVMYDYFEKRYNQYMSNGKRKGIVAVKRLKPLTDTERKKFHNTYKTILGRNIYSQDLRDYCYTPYNGKYYSDCSSSGMRTFFKINSSYSFLKDYNTQEIYESSRFETVNVKISNGHITNPEILKVGDCLLFAGNPSRPKYIGHVEYVYEISGTTSSSSSTLSSSSKVSTPTKLTESVAWNGIVTASSLNVRSWAGAENSTVSFSPLPSGTKVGVCAEIKADDGSSWYYIKYNGKYGFVSAEHVKKS